MTVTRIEIPMFEEGRLRYRTPRMDDLVTYHAFCASDRSIGVGGPYPFRDQAFDQLAGIIGHWHLLGYGRWLIADVDTDAPLGLVGLMYPPDWPEPEIAWKVFEAAEGKGVAHEAAQFARRYAYETLGWSTVVSCTAEGNTRSEALAQRMGATRESVYEHPEIGPLTVWRHLPPEALP